MKNEKEWTVGELLGTSSAYWRSCTLQAGVRLEIFTIIGDENLSTAEVAARVNGSERGVTALLNALSAMGLLQKDGDSYANTEASKLLLVKDSPRYVGYLILHHHHLVDGWAQLDQAVLTGNPVEKRSYGVEKERESFQLGMFTTAMANAPRLGKEIDLAGRKHLLDLGGGPGTYAIHFCMANPELKATIFDLPTTEVFARKTAERFGVAERIDFMAGDFNLDEITGCYDAAWLSHILHSNGPEACERLIAKTVKAMEPGGLIMIHDFFLDETMAAPLFPALFALNMLLNNDGRSYSAKEVGAMMTKAGVKDVGRLPFQGPNDSYIVCGIT